MSKTGRGPTSTGIVWFNVSLDTFRSFWRRWGDCSISQDCNHSKRWGKLHSATPQCVRCWV